MAGPKTVTLVDPEGREYNSSHPSEVVSLVYGYGYKVKGNKSVDEAIDFLADKNAVAPADAAVPAQGSPTKQS